MNILRLKIGVIILCVLVLAVGVSSSIFFANKKEEKLPPSPIVKKEQSLKERLVAQKTIKKFSNYEEMAEFLEKNNSTSSYGGGYYSRASSMPMASAFSSLETAAGSSAPSTPDYSRTNIQVKGVDEADIIKTDGHYIYALVRNVLYIVKSSPATESVIVSKIDFKSRPQELFINGDRLIVFGVDSVFQDTEFYRSFRRRNEFMYLSIYDVSDRTAPKEIRNLKFEGSYSTSRMIGDYVYLVTNSYRYGSQGDENVLPKVVENAAVLSNVCDAKAACFAPDAYYFDIPYESYSLATLLTVNVKDTSANIEGDVYVLPSAENMYVSQTSAYITYTKRLNETDVAFEVARELVYPLLNEKERGRISAIEAVDDVILSKQEKTEKISQILARHIESGSDEEMKKFEELMKNALNVKYADLADELEKTVIHKVAIEKNSIEYKATGEVNGHVLNQFSMDEHSDYFRIATTKSREWSHFGSDEDPKESYSNLFVLDGNMNTVGSLEKLAEGEQIYSVRFMQNRAYLVTFKQTDPLFVVDLEDPKIPKILGQLKIPGFSNYLHPYDDTTLIGLGKETTETESGAVLQKGIKLSLFDVSDVAVPKEINTYVIGENGSSSIAAQDHKAFLFSRERNLLVIPVALMEKQDGLDWATFTFGGVLVFTVDKKGFTLRGRIDHSDSGSPSEQDYFGGYSYYDNTVKRSLYVDDALYTSSNSYLKVNSLKDLREIKKISFEKEQKESIVPELPMK